MFNTNYVIVSIEKQNKNCSELENSSYFNCGKIYNIHTKLTKFCGPAAVLEPPIKKLVDDSMFVIHLEVNQQLSRKICSD